MTLRIYLAGALATAPRMSLTAEHFRIAGHSVTSTWHDTADSPFDPNDAGSRDLIWITNRRDLSLANVVYLDTTQGTPRCALVELGIAIEAGKHIVWMQRPDRSDRNMSDMHHGVRVVTTWAEVLPLLHFLEGEVAQAASVTRLRMPSSPAGEAFALAGAIASAPRKASR